MNLAWGRDVYFLRCARSKLPTLIVDEVKIMQNRGSIGGIFVIQPDVAKVLTNTISCVIV